MTSCLEAPRLDLPTFVGPQIFRYVNSVSDGEDSASHGPDLSFRQDETINSSSESLR